MNSDTGRNYERQLLSRADGVAPRWKPDRRQRIASIVGETINVLGILSLLALLYTLAYYDALP